MTSVERLVGLGLHLVFTDRNAVLEHAHHTTDVAELETLIDWQLMQDRY